MLAFQEVDDSLLSLIGNFSLPFLVAGWEEEASVVHVHFVYSEATWVPEI